MPQSTQAHPDFQISILWSMNILPSGTESIVPESGQIIWGVISQAVNSITYTNQTVIYVPVSSYTSDINYQTNDLSISVVESRTYQK